MGNRPSRHRPARDLPAIPQSWTAPAANDFDCWLRLDDLDAFVAPMVEYLGGRVGYRIDRDGRLLRPVDNRAT